LSFRPFPGRGLTSRSRSYFDKVRGVTGCPPWIAPEFTKRMALEARWKEFSSLPLPTSPHPSRPVAHASLQFREWTRMFEMGDPGVTHFPVETSYPFLDLTLVEYLLAIPVFPWAFKKTLERKAMRGKLPEEILRRKKTALSKDVSTKLVKNADERLRRETLDGKILEYVTPPKRNNSF